MAKMITTPKVAMGERSGRATALIVSNRLPEFSTVTGMGLGALASPSAGAASFWMSAAISSSATAARLNGPLPCDCADSDRERSFCSTVTR